MTHISKLWKQTQYRPNFKKSRESKTSGILGVKSLKQSPGLTESSGKAPLYKNGAMGSCSDIPVSDIETENINKGEI